MCNIPVLQNTGNNNNQDPKSPQQSVSKIPKPSLLKEYDEDDVKKHMKVNDCWVIYKGYVYDISKYIQLHPGGSEVILKLAGSDITSQTTQCHPYLNTVEYLKEYQIGKLVFFKMADVHQLVQLQNELNKKLNKK